MAVWALLGSGEFQPWAEQVDRWMLDRARTGPVLILPTASAPEGDGVFDRWGRMGLEHYRRIGVEAEVLPLKERGDADRPELVQRLESAAAVFFSGGNPTYLAEALAGSAFWRAVVDHLDRGMAYAGCSAGVAAIGDRCVWRLDEGSLRDGLRLIPGANFAPHWDWVERFAPGARDRLIEWLGPPARLVGIDERTALVGDGRRWTVIGAGGAHVLSDGEWRRAVDGQRLSIPG